MAVRRYACDSINGNNGNSGIALFEGDFSNAKAGLFECLDQANTDIVNDGNTDTFIIEVSGGPSGAVYPLTKNLMITASGTNNYTSGTGFATNGTTIGDYGIVASKAAGHDGFPVIDAAGITAPNYTTYGPIASNRRGALFEGFGLIGTPNSSPSKDPIELSTANFSAVRNCLIHQGSHGILSKRAEDVEITGNMVIGQNGPNASAIKVEQDLSPQATRALVASNYVWKGGASTGTSGHFGIQLFGAQNCQVYNNTLVDTTTDGIGLLSTALNNDIKNNIVVNSIDNGNTGDVGHDIAIDATSAAGNTNTIDHNTYATNKYYLGGTFDALAGWTGGTQYTDLASWQAATSQDSNSITDTPVFVGGSSPDSVDGIQLVQGSAQIGAGTPTTWTTDIIGQTFASPPNMGAYALFFSSGTSPTLTKPYKVIVIDIGSSGSINFNDGNWLGASSFLITELPVWASQDGTTATVNYTDATWGGRNTDTTVGSGLWYINVQALDSTGDLSTEETVLLYVR